MSWKYLNGNRLIFTRKSYPNYYMRRTLLPSTRRSLREWCELQHGKCIPQDYGDDNLIIYHFCRRFIFLLFWLCEIERDGRCAVDVCISYVLAARLFSCHVSVNGFWLPAKYHSRRQSSPVPLVEGHVERKGGERVQIAVAHDSHAMNRIMKIDFQSVCAVHKLISAQVECEKAQPFRHLRPTQMAQ